MPTLQILVPTQERYEQVMQRLNERFPGIILGPIGHVGEPVEVSPLIEERFYWLHLLGPDGDGSIEDFTYEA